MREEALHPVQFAAYRRMTPRQKLDQALALYWSARSLKADYLRSRHPEWSEEQVQAAVSEIFLKEQVQAAVSEIFLIARS